jgi:hypothetical protein
MDNMNMPSDKKQEVTFKCPSCDMEMVVEAKGESDSEHEKFGKKPNAGSMPMGQLRSKITPSGQPNLNSH